MCRARIRRAVAGKEQSVTTDNGVSAESAEARLERIHQRLGEGRQRTLQLSTRVRAANDTATEIRATPHKVCHHGEEVKELTAALAHVEHELDGLRVAMATRGVIERA